MTQGQIGPSQFGSGDDTFHFTSFLLGATHGHPVTWLRWSCRALKPCGRQLDQKSQLNTSMDACNVYVLKTIDACIMYLYTTKIFHFMNLDASLKYGGCS